MTDKNKWKTVSIPSELNEKVKEYIKDDPQYYSRAEFVRHAITNLLRTKAKRN